MQIKGLQKHTLADYPGKVACAIFLFGCNLRCGFCHNPGLILPDDSLATISEEELFSFLEKRKGILDGVCITGGEPLITLEADFVQKIREMGFAVKLDTNGSFPDKLKKFIQQRLVDFVAMDIKTSKEEYSAIGGSNVDIDAIEKSIKMISELPAYEFRTTVVPSIHSLDNIMSIREWLLEVTGKERLLAYHLQGFVPRVGGMLDSSFDTEPKAAPELLEQMRDAVQDSFEKCTVRL